MTSVVMNTFHLMGAKFFVLVALLAQLNYAVAAATGKFLKTVYTLHLYSLHSPKPLSRRHRRRRRFFSRFGGGDM